MRNVQRSLNVVATVVVACAVATTIVVGPLTTLLTLAFPRAAHNFICACFACTSLSVSPRSTTHAHAHPCVLLFACLLLLLLLLLALVDFAACVCRAYAGPAPKLMSGLGCGCAALRCSALFVFHLRSAPSRMQRFFPSQLPRCLCVCCTQNAAPQATVHRACMCALLITARLGKLVVFMYAE